MAQIWHIVDDLSCCEASKDRFKNVDNTGFFQTRSIQQLFKVLQPLQGYFSLCLSKQVSFLQALTSSQKTRSSLLLSHHCSGRQLV